MDPSAPFVEDLSAFSPTEVARALALFSAHYEKDNQSFTALNAIGLDAGAVRATYTHLPKYHTKRAGPMKIPTSPSRRARPPTRPPARPPAAVTTRLPIRSRPRSWSG